MRDDVRVGGNPSIIFVRANDNIAMSSWLACIENRCRPCPSGATCPGGAVVLARQGWWEGSDATFYKCDDSTGCCPHGNCLRGTASACATHRVPTSRLCSQCEAGLQLWCVAGLHCMLHLCCYLFYAWLAACVLRSCVDIGVGCLVCRAGGCAHCDSVNWGYIGLLVVFGTALCFCLVHLKKGEVRGSWDREG